MLHLVSNKLNRKIRKKRVNKAISNKENNARFSKIGIVYKGLASRFIKGSED